MAAGRQELVAWLDDLGIATATHQHVELFSVEEARALRGEIPGAHSKNLFLKSKKGSLWLVVALETTRVDLTVLSKSLRCGRFSFGSADLLHQTLGVEPGSVTPFALINDTVRQVRIILDHGLMTHENLNFHPLDNTATTTIARDDLIAFLEACGHTPEILPLQSAQAPPGG